MANPHLAPLGRRDFPRLFWDLGCRTGAEIGVLDGTYLLTFCQAGFSMVGVDRWEPYDGYFDFKDRRNISRAHQKAIDRTTPFGARLIQGDSIEVAGTIPDGSLDFVYIDANHRYGWVKRDLEAWAPKVRSGGVISGHDFLEPHTGRNQVARAVREYTTAHQIDPWYITQAAPETLPDGDCVASYYWVQP